MENQGTFYIIDKILYVNQIDILAEFSNSPGGFWVASWSQ